MFLASSSSLSTTRKTRSTIAMATRQRVSANLRTLYQLRGIFRLRLSRYRRNSNGADRAMAAKGTHVRTVLWKHGVKSEKFS